MMRSPSRRFSIVLAAALLAFVAGPAQAEGARYGINVLDYALEDLATGDVVELATLRGRVPMLMFFEPGCALCERQARILQKLAAACAAIRPLAIGVHGDAAQLLAALEGLRPGFRAFLADDKLLRDIGELPPAPALLLGDRSGDLVTYFTGLQDAAALADALAPLAPECDL